MGRLPSAETQLRTLKRYVRELETENRNLRTNESGYRIRATKAEQEVSEWKKRFDALLFQGYKDSP